MATRMDRNIAVGGATFSLGGGHLLQILGNGHVRIINILDGPDQIPLVGFQEKLSTVNAVEVTDAKISRLARSLFAAIEQAPAVKARVAL